MNGEKVKFTGDRQSTKEWNHADLSKRICSASHWKNTKDRELLRHYTQSVVQPSHIASPINLQADTYGKENHF